MKRFMFVVALLFLMMGCGEKVITFDSPQPVGVDSLTAIPKQLVGSYVSKDGSSILTINRNSMVVKYDYDVKFLRDSSNLNDLSREDSLEVHVEGDSVIEHVSETDTIFCLSKNYVLKKFKGYYFLNSRRDKESWYVQKIRLKKGIFTIGSISTAEELKTIEKINETPVDTTSYRIHFNRKQFHDYINDEGFSKVDTFIRSKR